MQDFAAKYRNILSEMILAKELMSQVNLFLQGKMSGGGDRAAVEDTVKMLDMASRNQENLRTLEDLYLYPGQEVARGFTIEVEKVTKTLKVFKPPTPGPRAY